MTYITLYMHNTGFYQSTVCSEVCVSEVGEERNFSSLVAPRGAAVGTFQAGFTVTMKTRGQSESAHKAGNTQSLALHLLTKRARTFDQAAA